MRRWPSIEFDTAVSSGSLEVRRDSEGSPDEIGNGRSEGLKRRTEVRPLVQIRWPLASVPHQRPRRKISARYCPTG
jgi:hypothetical protein